MRRDEIMAFFEDVILTDSIKIKTTPEKIFEFLTGIVDDESYRAWHQEDHVSFRWLKGPPWTEGSVIYAEEYIHGKLHKLKFKITQIVPKKRKKTLCRKSSFSSGFFYYSSYPLFTHQLSSNLFKFSPSSFICFLTLDRLLSIAFPKKVLPIQPKR